MIPIIITVRKQSQRCPNKILREFCINSDGEALSLLDICLGKFRGNKDVYVAGFEPEFEEIAYKYGVSFIQRTEESALSEDPLVIHSHLKDQFKYVCQLNPCCPMAKAETVHKAIDTFENLKIQSLFSVKKSYELIFNSDRGLVNVDRVFNSKIRKPNYVGNNVIVIYNTEVFFNTGSYWSYKPGDPYLFVMSEIESVDIDTKLDFKIAQANYQYFQ